MPPRKAIPPFSFGALKRSQSARQMIKSCSTCPVRPGRFRAPFLKVCARDQASTSIRSIDEEHPLGVLLLRGSEESDQGLRRGIERFQGFGFAGMVPAPSPDARGGQAQADSRAVERTSSRRCRRAWRASGSVLPPRSFAICATPFTPATRWSLAPFLHSDHA